ncbi:MAG TPA: DnaJ domain-containing protein [Myxococcaceae bacterium]|nr:DnaJ domain-containing protein [Myxococcaceae bacterium]
MIELFSIQDRDVSRKLRERAVIAPGLVLVSGTRQSKHSRPVTEREPYASLERRFGQYLTQLVVVEEEGSQVAWRDPLGDLGTAFFPEDKAQAYAASNGYLLLKNGAVEDVVKKQGSPEKDAWSIQEALAAAHRMIPRPGQATKRASGPQSPRQPGPPLGSVAERATDRRPRIEDPEAHAPTPPWGARATGDWVAQPDAEEVTPVPVVEADPWATLGVAPGTAVSDARKAFRALMTQYHPDKVAHLAPEFRELAERKTRQITEAWERIQREAKDESPEE